MSPQRGHQMEKAIPWSHYSGPAKAEFASFNKLFKNADLLLVFLARNYGLQIKVPPVLVHETDQFVAYASPSHEVNISSGVICHLALLEKKLLSRSMRHGGFVLDAGQLIVNFFLWIIAHEFFHIARGHFNVLNDHPTCTLAIEYDADCMATVGLLRALQYLHKDTPEILAKQSIVASNFWALRDWVGQSSPSSIVPDQYPSWHFRLYGMIAKLAWTGNFDRDTQMPTSGLDEHAKTLFGLASKLDLHHCLINDIPVGESSFANFLKSGLSVSHAKLVNVQWNNVRPSVEKHQFLRLTV
jgi:hypothetical protein